MNELTDKELIKSVFVNPTIASKIVDMATSKRPRGWSHRSNATYFKKVYADEIYPLIKQMMLDGNDILYSYTDFCNESTGISKQSLYNRVNQSLLYLKEFLPESELEAFLDWNERTRCWREANVGVRIEYVPGLGPNDKGTKEQPRPKSVSSVSNIPIWTKRMNEWLEDVDNYEPYIKENLALNPQEVVDLKVKISQLKNVQASITEQYVRLIRIDV